ncbi:nicotinamidase-related amidase [Desulfobotulus alkaliphilus]|uniref:Nicotinamidase-related amidase n=1 Tax=Desulfobotulus alkaliphilus TaxID=622671 RepID=A0A562S208_9BACT|nr:isochorismatase family protein [Desulfobotulus alkaliphilus]TWI75349.1 nicotinamidase-related amidase [Desulfobotulus alkaliphilus]
MNTFLASPCLVVVDVQQRLLTAMEDAQSLVDRCARVIRGAKLLNIPLCFFDQNPHGLGPVLPELRFLASEAPLFTKQHFGGHRHGFFRNWLAENHAGDILICGIEAHVCVAQTAMGLAGDGFRVHVAMDAVASRKSADKEAGLLRMQAFGVFPACVEGLLFEAMGRADVPEFKDFLEIVK